MSLFQREEFPGIQGVHFHRPLWAEIPVLFSGIPAPAEVSIPTLGTGQPGGALQEFPAGSTSEVLIN